MFQCTTHAAPACSCLPGRRGMLGLLAAAAVAPAVPMRAARASEGQYEAMLLNCIDPRFTSSSAAWMTQHELRGRYSQFVIAGGPLGAVHPRFAAWHQAFWDNLGITLQLHHIRRVVAFAHRDCGAAKLALGEAAIATPAAETTAFVDVLAQFRAAVAQRHPNLPVVGGLMALDGSVTAL